MKQVYDLQKVGGKAYHLMEMTKAGLPVPSFAVFAFDCFDQSKFRSAESRTTGLG